MNDTEAKRSRLWQLIYDAQGEADQQAANSIYRDAEALAIALRCMEPDNAEHCYAIALTYYHRWDAHDVRAKCVEWFHKTKQLDPDHPWVPLFLGYQYMDSGRFAEAYEELNRVNRQYFSSIEQHWRNIKTDELMIVAQILGGLSLVDFSLLVRLVDRYASADLIDRPVPTEIVKALAVPTNRERFTAPTRDVASEVSRLIRACGVVSAFPQELADLDAAANPPDITRLN